jgi:hypothetical protein
MKKTELRKIYNFVIDQIEAIKNEQETDDKLEKLNDLIEIRDELFQDLLKNTKVF